MIGRASLVVAVVLVAGAACKKKKAEDPTLREARESACRDAVADGLVTEARAWLDPTLTTHLGFEVGKDEMRELTEAFYAAGALKVSAAWGEHEGTQISALLIVDLPPEMRESLFAKLEEIRGRFDLDEVPDVGQ